MDAEVAVYYDLLATILLQYFMSIFIYSLYVMSNALTISAKVFSTSGAVQKT